MRDRRPAFPVGLYGMLLFALCWLVLPVVFAPLEGILVGAGALVVRVFAAFAGTPVQAAADGGAAGRALVGELAARVQAHAVPAVAAWTNGADPLHCAVVALGRRGTRTVLGGGGEPCELLLDHTYAELVGCRRLVTKGQALVGWLQVPGQGIAVDDSPDDRARVMLVNHPQAPAMHAELVDTDAEPLRLVVRAAKTADPAPLRVDLWHDPWRASRLDRAGLPVRTRATAGQDTLPPGLFVGRTRIWGYTAAADGEPFTLGVFVVPAVAAQALSHVVVWRVAAVASTTTGDTAASSGTLHAMPGVLHELPGSARGRYLLVTQAPAAAGAAVVVGGRLLGLARPLAFGSALMTSFAASRQRWNLVLLPDEPSAAPIELQAEVTAAVGTSVCLRVLAGTSTEFAGPVSPVRGGWLFTGTNGIACPSGLQIGRCEPDPGDPLRLRVSVPHDGGPLAVDVLAVPEAR
jgi:hypothetical protein